jgi:hypothetical protein
MHLTTIGLVVSGVALLVLGWKLFWLFVGLVGFAAGLQAVQLLLGPQPFWILWAAGLVCGIIGAVLALFSSVWPSVSEDSWPAAPLPST